MSNYDANQISVLEGLEAVRKRPGMYIGNTGQSGLHRAFGEILDNSVDEYMAGHASQVRVEIQKNGKVWVADDGRGIPTDLHTKTGKSALETILTVLHAGGKFDQNNYKFSGGLHGVGASVVNALSKNMDVWVLRKDRLFYMGFEKGKVVTELQEMSLEDGYTKYPFIQDKVIWTKSGTLISFEADTTIFETKEFNIPLLNKTLKQTAYLNKGFKIKFIAPEIDTDFCFPEGILTYLQDITTGEELITPIVQFEAHQEKFHLELALAYSKDYKEKLYPFTNGILNSEGGSHVTGLRTALAKVINGYAKDKGFFKKDEKFTSEDLKEGLRVVLSIKMVDPQFTSQSKVKLGSTIARSITDKLVSDKLSTFFEENPKEAQSVILKAQLALKARMAARAARDAVVRKGALEGNSLPGKLADCASKKPEDSEIYIVEGDSAGGSAKQARDRETQAILPLWGKVMNTEKATLDRILNYEGLKNMVIALGTGVGEQFSIDKLRYHKVVLMTDADVDGAHITTLLLTFLYRYMPELIEAGNIYLARPPLFKISVGKKVSYVYSDEERDLVIKTYQKDYPGKKIEIQRYKGLGEMNPQQLWETTMDPATRVLFQITVGEAAMADQVFVDLMGADVAPRRKFIEENAQFADVDLVA